MKKNLMKKGVLLLGVVGSLVLATSCKDSRESISASKIKSLVEENLEERGKSQKYKELHIGYYEENDHDTRYELRQLAAADVITYKAERFEVEETYNQKHGNWYTGYTYKKVVRKKEHIMVDVALTSKGKRYVVDGIPEVSDEDVDLLDAPRGVFPEDCVSYEEIFETPKPVEQPEEYETPEVKEESSPSEMEQIVESDNASQEAEEVKEPTPYEKALAKVNSSYVIVKTFALEVVKVRDITLNPFLGEAAAEVIIQTTDTTPFGRIMSGVYDGERDSDKVSFVYYEDKGWRVD